MATYKEIQGTAVQSLTSSTGTEEGQIWYSTPTGDLKLQRYSATGAWASAPAPAVNVDSFSSGGTQTAAILSGSAGANPANAAKAEEYDGSSWTALTDMPAAYGYNVSCGTVSDWASMGGGYPGNVSTVYDWDGSNWTTGASLPTPSIEAGVCGPGQQALYVGGATPGGFLSATHERSGGSWATTGTLNNARYASNVTGTKADARCSGGYGGSYTAASETYNGSIWANSTAMPAGRGYAGSAGSSSTDQFLFGGGPSGGNGTTSIKWDGSSWSADASLNSAKAGLGGFGSSTAALCGGSGNSPAASEEYTGPGVTTKTITLS